MSKTLADLDPELYAAIAREARRQSDNLELIASENYTSEAVMEAQGSLLTNKYAEGYPGKRYYGGCEFVDQVEVLAIDRAKKLFGAEHVNVQPHSGSQANMAMYLSVLKPGDGVMGLNLAHGGHLSHGHPMNFSGKYYKIIPIDVRKDDELIDYEKAEKDAREHKPRILFVGASNYSRVIDWARLKKIADEIGALFAADIAHYAGMIAAGVYPSPVGLADFTTTTTHKTLRGPRGGMVMCKTAHAKALDSSVFPGEQGGPLMHVIAAKAVCFGEALKPEFKVYQQKTLANSRRLAKALQDRGFRIVAGGTDCHVFSLDLRPKNATGKEAEEALDKAGITVNKNAIPYDPQKPFIASGVRIGAPAITTRGMGEKEMDEVATFIDEALKVRGDDAALKRVKEGVTALCRRFPIYPGTMEKLLAQR
ncbi:MAG: serine hydroxymethyltransferase [Elusimicrobiota bacterium]|nr:MAG: serine hydroxymethyltransferase [Elusimicrobiota bacterium]